MEATAGAHPEHNLPLALTSLVRRARELAAIGDTLRRTRLVTITGPGAVGKTRTALDIARSQLTAQADGAWLVDLAAGDGGRGINHLVARA